jgi:hypothetical protein
MGIQRQFYPEGCGLSNPVNVAAPCVDPDLGRGDEGRMVE